MTTNATLQAPFNVSEFTEFVLKSRTAGYSDEEIRVALRKSPYKASAIDNAFRLADDDQAREQALRKDALRECSRRATEAAREKKKAKEVARLLTRLTRAGRVYRKITEDDPSLHGSDLLGREGEYAWLPRN